MLNTVLVFPCEPRFSTAYLCRPKGRIILQLNYYLAVIPVKERKLIDHLPVKRERDVSIDSNVGLWQFVLVVNDI